MIHTACNRLTPGVVLRQQVFQAAAASPAAAREPSAEVGTPAGQPEQLPDGGGQRAVPPYGAVSLRGCLHRCFTRITVILP